MLVANKSKIAFYVDASNKCGSSLKVHESLEENGIPLAGVVENSATLKLTSIGILDTLNLNELISPIC